MTAGSRSGRIFAGVGGWTYEPWRGVFYPETLPQKRELEFASRQLTAIELVVGVKHLAAGARSSL